MRMASVCSRTWRAQTHIHRSKVIAEGLEIPPGTTAALDCLSTTKEMTDILGEAEMVKFGPPEYTGQDMTCRDPDCLEDL